MMILQSLSVWLSRYTCISCLLLQAMIGTTVQADTETLPQIDVAQLKPQLAVGDLVFIRVDNHVFIKVADTTLSWTNHVGVVTRAEAGQVTVSESTVPLSRETRLEQFIARSAQTRVAVMRLQQPLSDRAQQAISVAAKRRLGILYDTGFNLHSPRQFCSRFAREVIAEATGVPLGQVQTFRELLAQNPQADLVFWKRWYLGNIPWARETVTPASVLQDPRLKQVYAGKVVL